MSNRLKHEEYMDSYYDGGDEQFGAIGGTSHNNYMSTPEWRKPKNYDEEKPFFDVLDSLEINGLEHLDFRYFSDLLISIVDEKDWDSYYKIQDLFSEKFNIDIVNYKYPLII